MSGASSSERLLQLLVANPAIYALGGPDEAKPWKYRYKKIEQPLTPEVVQDHLDGARTIGTYCEHDGKSRWFCYDFDAPKDENDHAVDGGFEIALGEARRWSAALLKRGLFTMIERSRSGNGVHVWGFLDEMVDARHLAGILDNILLSDFPREDAEKHLQTVDRGKRYPPLKDSKSSILICMPYAGEAVESGNSMFLDVELGSELTLDEFLAEVVVNKASVLERIAPQVKASAASTVGAAVTAAGGDGEAAARAVRVEMGDWDGRPAKLGTGIIKMLSPFGCNAMRQIWLQQNNPKMVSEREWYAFLGQLSAFKHGRDAAHSIFIKHRFYNERGCNEKFDHALANPPVGCAFIHSEFPQFKCAGCPMTAPYRKGYQSLTQLCGETPAELERAVFEKDLERIRRVDASPEPEGITTGIPGLDRKFRFTQSMFAAFGAQPSIGKTALLVHMAVRIAKTGVDVNTFSAESGPISLHDRMIAHESGVDSYALKGLRMHNGQKVPLSPQEWEEIEAAIDRLNKLPIWENYTTSNAERIYDAIEAMKMKRRKPLTDPVVSFFDYFQYAQGSDKGRPEDEHVRLAKASHNLKCVTKVTEDPFATMAQLTRDTEGEEDPKINQFRGTARLEHDIDVGVMMTGQRMPGRLVPRMLHGVKNREGEAGWKEELLMEQAVSRFQDKGSIAETEKEKLHDEPWEGAGNQFSMLAPKGD